MNESMQPDGFGHVTGVCHHEDPEIANKKSARARRQSLQTFNQRLFGDILKKSTQKMVIFKNLIHCVF